MSKSDVEMDDTEKLPHDSGNQESENKVVKIESDGQELPSAAAGAADADKSEDGGEDLNKDRNEEKDETAIKTEVNVHTEPKSEVNEPLVAEGSVQEQVNTESDTAGLIDAKTTAEEPIIPRSGVGEKIDDEIEAVEQNDVNSGVAEEKSIEKGIEGGDSLKTALDGETKEDASEEKCKEISCEDADSLEHVEGSENAKQSPHAVTVPKDIGQSPAELSANEVPQIQAAADETPQGDTEKIQDKANLNENKPVNDEMKEQHTGTEVVLASSGTEVVLASSGTEVVLGSSGTDGNAKTLATPLKHEGGDSSQPQHEISTPSSLVRYSPAKVGDHSGERVKNIYTQSTQSLMGEDDDGTPEEQAAFMKEIESFYRGRAMDFKPPKFYGQPLNCLKLWRATIRLGGYDRVTGSKLWRQVGESFHPPKTCTTVSWTFRIFYEKSLLEYERHKTQSGELQLPAILPEASGVDIEGNGNQGSGRARRDAAARAMQGWHSQRVSGSGEVGEPIIKDKNVSSTAKREKNLKGLGSLKQKRPNEAEHSIKAARTEASKQLVTSVVDVGPPADWVKVNVRQTKDSFEVYALVPGLLREEVRVQSDPAGRVVITGQPEQADNPWGITAFKKVVSLPARIDPLQTSAVVSLHGRLFVRVPFEQPHV